MTKHTGGALLSRVAHAGPLPAEYTLESTLNLARLRSYFELIIGLPCSFSGIVTSQSRSQLEIGKSHYDRHIFTLDSHPDILVSRCLRFIHYGNNLEN
ncbi:hypothetical protein BV22DRAFT_1030550 [Leucogyrophana mollusca]|uniref:Uncharacterized protein n=1 Tax=Leucogyrophana mollusca TaxID=85980 RepID=A0ACB8BSI6_9AGAM|nr:hypothetical protein BV22DRAFT_1030550 [Leucogyrophana mollusca]